MRTTPCPGRSIDRQPLSAAGAVSAGLAIAALTDTCAMGMVLAKMLWNRRGPANSTSPIEELVARG